MIIGVPSSPTSSVAVPEAQSARWESAMAAKRSSVDDLDRQARQLDRLVQQLRRRSSAPG